MQVNCREIVLDILLELEKGEAFSSRLIKAVLDKYDYLDGRDKGFIKRLAEGTIERQIELDYYLNQISAVKVPKMKPLIRCLLRMGAYQIVYMDAVPDSAVCNEACKLAGKRGFHNLKGFVNGVLRNLVKRKGSLFLPDEGDKTEYLSVKYSMPAWLVELWLEEYGSSATETLLEGLLRIHPVYLRFRADLPKEEQDRLTARMEALGAAVRPSGYLPGIYAVENIEGLHKLPGFAEGAFVVQDVSSALAVEAAGIKKGDFVMDICAAPGGKCILASEKAGQVLARDVSEAKVSLIRENLERMGRTNVAAQVYDAAVTDESYLEKADVVLMDVPCSGLGVLGKKRDIKYHVTKERMESLVGLQREIVEKSWRYVKPGGILLYSTCTIHRAENEDMVRWITEQFPFEPVSVRDALPEALLARVQMLGCSPDDGWIQMLPGHMESDGFFFAKLRRRHAPA